MSPLLRTGFRFRCFALGLLWVSACYSPPAETETTGDNISSTTGGPISTQGTRFGQTTRVTSGRAPCALLTTGAIKCWGYNADGNLGTSNLTEYGKQTSEMASLPTVPLGQAAVSVATNVPFSSSYGSYACAVLANYQVKCWGFNGHGQLGLGDTLQRSSPDAAPIRLGTGRTASSVAAGTEHVCALLDTHQVVCWGNNGEPFAAGELGDGSTASTVLAPATTVQLPPGRTALDVQAGNFSTCVLLDDHTLSCWGFNNHGQLGYGDVVTRRLPGGPISFGGRTVTSYSVGFDSACALLSDTSLHCWGSNAFGQLGLGNLADVLSPSLVNLGAGRYAVSVAAGPTTCAILDNGELRCWGRNTRGEVGIGTLSNVAVATGPSVVLGSGLTAVQVSSHVAEDSGAICALLGNGEVRCWGANDHGELGLGDTLDRGGTPQTLPVSYPPIDL